MDEFETMLGIFIMMLGSAFFTAVLGLLIHMFVQSARRERRSQRAIDTYQRIVIEKMDVLKTAIAVGFDSDQLDELDTRLERLIGAEKLQELMGGKAVAIATPPAAMDEVLYQQVERISRQRSAGSAQ